MNLKQISERARNLSLRTQIAAVAAMAPVLSFAQTADPFDQAVLDVTAKVEAYGPKLVGLGAVAVIFFVALKYVKKIPRAS